MKIRKSLLTTALALFLSGCGGDRFRAEREYCGATEDCPPPGQKLVGEFRKAGNDLEGVISLKKKKEGKVNGISILNTLILYPKENSITECTHFIDNKEGERIEHIYEGRLQSYGKRAYFWWDRIHLDEYIRRSGINPGDYNYYHYMLDFRNRTEPKEIKIKVKFDGPLTGRTLFAFDPSYGKKVPPIEWEIRGKDFNRTNQFLINGKKKNKE